MKSRMMIMMAAGAIMAFRGVLAADVPANSSRLTYAENSDGTLMVTGVEPGGIVDGKLIVPKSHDGTNVTAVSMYAFAGNLDIQAATVPETITSLPEGIFANCANLSEIEMPDSIIDIGSYAFYLCIALEFVNFPTSLETIGWNAFQGSGLKSLTLPDSVTLIGGFSFADCTQVTNVSLSAGLDRIPDYAFLACKSLERIVLPPNIGEIGNYAFADNNLIYPGLKSVVIPVACTNIGSRAFVCIDTLDLYFEGDAPPTVGATPVFFVSDSKVTLHFKSGANGFDKSPWNGPQYVIPDEGDLIITAFAVEGEKMNFTVRLVDEQGGQNIPDAGRKVRLLGAGLLTEEFEECSEPIALDANGSFEANLPEGKTTFFFKVRLEPAE